MRLLTTEELIMLNRYAQGVVEKHVLYQWFNALPETEKHELIRDLWVITTQAKATEADVLEAAKRAGPNATDAPIQVLLSQKIPFQNRGYKLSHFDGKLLEQSFNLITECFAIAEKRRKMNCEAAGNCQHWWHQDLSDPKVITRIFHIK